MLTVLHRHDDGTETIYQCQSVSRECRDAPTVPPSGDVILRGVPDPEFLYGGPGSCWEGEGRIRIASGARSACGMDPMIFVMNRHGATVARHYL